MMKIEYVNWSTKIFEGFYDSNLYCCDSMYYVLERDGLGDCKLPEGYNWDFYDFYGFQNAVGEEAVDLIYDGLPHEILRGFEFVEIDSPREYNFRTDRIVANAEIAEDLLEKYCFEENRGSFAIYLVENYTTHSGFISFVPNNINEFENWEDEKIKWQVMLEFYILENLDLEDYEENLFYFAEENLDNRLCLEKDGKFYSFSIDEDSKTVNVESEIR